MVRVDSMKNIYIVLSQSGSIVSKVIAKKTKHNYNHCSLSFDPDLIQMYSMGRIFPNNPVIGGLVIEKPNYGTYKKFDKTICMVLEVPVTNQQYYLMREEVRYMISESHKYHYNYAGLFLGSFDLCFERKDHYMCSEFLRHVLDAGEYDTSFLPMIPHPVDFMDIENKSIVYEGYLNNLGVKMDLSYNC